MPGQEAMISRGLSRRIPIDRSFNSPQFSRGDHDVKINPFFILNPHGTSSKYVILKRRRNRPRGPPSGGGPRTLLEEDPFAGSPSNGRRKYPPPCHPSKEHPPMNSSPNAPWKGGRERSERWRETRNKGFPPRVSDGTGSPGGRG